MANKIEGLMLKLTMNFQKIQNTTLLNLPYQTITHNYYYYEENWLPITMDQCITKW